MEEKKKTTSSTKKVTKPAAKTSTNKTTKPVAKTSTKKVTKTVEKVSEKITKPVAKKTTKPAAKAVKPVVKVEEPKKVVKKVETKPEIEKIDTIESKENKKGLVALIVLVIAIIALIALSVSGGKAKYSEETYNKFKAAMDSETPTLVYIGRPTCGYCSLLTPSLEEMTERYNFSYIYVNTDEMTSKYMNQLMADLNISQIGTPYLTVVNNTGVVDTQNGYADYDVLFQFLQKNKIIDESAKLSLNYIGLDEYKTLLAGTEPSIVVIGQSTCSHCINTKLVLNKIADETGLKINYLNVSYMTEDQGKELEASLSYFSEKEWGTPLTMIIKEGKLVGTLEGERNKSDFETFFTEQGVLK